ncbi:hypothetical protein pb186bvf_003398 [Paramecium bursaria]
MSQISIIELSVVIKQTQIIPILDLSICSIMLISLINDFYSILVDVQINIIYQGLFIIYFYFKQHRLTSFVQLPAFCLLCQSQYQHHESYLLLFLAILFIFGSFAIVLIMPQYKFPQPTGQYLVGFKEITVANNKVSVYYPTLTKTKQNWINSCRNKDYVAQLYVDFQHVIKHRPPLFIIKWMMGYLNKIRVEGLQVDAPQIDGPIILFSNGLGGLKDHYSIFLKEWASQGFVVYAMQQEEITIILTEEEIRSVRNKEATIHNEKGKILLDKIKLVRNQQLNERVRTFKELLNYVDQDVILIGHSFGGATAYRTAQLESRIKGIVLYDPWFLPIKWEDLAHEIKCPILCINSDTFKLREENETPQRYEQGFGAQKQKLIVEIKGTQHLCTTDLVYVMPFELSIFDKLNHLHHIARTTSYHLWITNRRIEYYSEQ